MNDERLRGETIELYGISSKLPFFKGMHIGFFDFDTTSRIEVLRGVRRIREITNFDRSGRKILLYSSPSGYHSIFCKHFPFDMLAEIHARVPEIDQTWSKIGVKRGYWFLLTYCDPEKLKKQVMPYGLTYMKIEVPLVWFATKLQRAWMSSLRERRSPLRSSTLVSI